VPLLGSFDPSFLDVPREVIQLTMRTNQKYFALVDGEGRLAPNFICTANIEAADGGAAIVQGNQKVLAARLSDAKFFWEQDLKIPLEDQAKKLSQIVFHEKLGTVADKVDRVAKLARWLVEEGIVRPPLPQAGGDQRGGPVEAAPSSDSPSPSPSREREGSDLAALAETAARLAKADLVTQMVGEFPELQGIIGGYLARAQGHPREVADAIRDHYKLVGQGDEVPTAPVTVAVSLADRLDSIACFFAINERPTGSKDPFALRRSSLSAISLILTNGLRIPLSDVSLLALMPIVIKFVNEVIVALKVGESQKELLENSFDGVLKGDQSSENLARLTQIVSRSREHNPVQAAENLESLILETTPSQIAESVVVFLLDRLKVQQREAGVRHDLIDAVFALGSEDDLVRLLARVRALQSFVETPEGTDLLAGYKRAANILKKEGWQTPSPQRGEGQGEGAPPSADNYPPRTPSPSPLPEGEGLKKPLSYTPLPEEAALIAALESAEPRAAQAIAAEDFEGAMAALASLRAPVDAFFDKVTVNDPDPAKREARLDLLARMRNAVHQVADFSRIEG
jgi:glycyl-tRNA synthetase beta chain